MQQREGKSGLKISTQVINIIEREVQSAKRGIWKNAATHTDMLVTKHAHEELTTLGSLGKEFLAGFNWWLDLRKQTHRHIHARLVKTKNKKQARLQSTNCTGWPSNFYQVRKTMPRTALLHNTGFLCIARATTYAVCAKLSTFKMWNHSAATRQHTSHLKDRGSLW